jgi:hypothetical protein
VPSSEIPAPTAVLTLVFLAWTAGTAVGGAISRLSGEIQAGHFKVIWLVVAGISGAAGFGYHPAWFVTALALTAFAAVYRSRDREAGIVVALSSIAVLAFGAPLYSLAAAGLLGAVTNAMLLGHWHLNQPRLGIAPIERLVWALWGTLVAFVLATVLLLAVSPAGGIKTLGAVTGLAFAGFAGVLTAMVHHLVRTRSIMSATGVLYLEILLCFVATFTGSLAALAKT